MATMPRCLPSRLPGDHSGFTLLELIVAAAILALIAVFSWRGLDQLLREREAIASSQETLDGMQRAFARIERDALLARDAQLDESGALRLVSGSASVDYRFVNGTLTRAIDGADGSRAMTVQSGIAKLVIEAWTAGAKGGWVRVKGLATEALPTLPQASQPSQPSQSSFPQPSSELLAQQARAAGATAASPNPNQASPAFAGNSGTNLAAGGSANPNAAAPAGPLTALGQPLVAAATGIRLSITRNDGTEIVRVFLIGSGG